MRVDVAWRGGRWGIAWCRRPRLALGIHAQPGKPRLAFHLPAGELAFGRLSADPIPPVVVRLPRSRLEDLRLAR